MSNAYDRLKRGVRWNKDLEVFEMYCPGCATAGQGQTFWPLTTEFWEPTRLTLCRACIQIRKRSRLKWRRDNDEEYRQRCLDQSYMIKFGKPRPRPVTAPRASAPASSTSQNTIQPSASTTSPSTVVSADTAEAG